MNTYETTFILYTEQERLQKGKELVKNGFKNYEANILKEDDLGERDLAYMIKKQNKGHYYYLEVEMDSSKIIDLEKELKLSTDILKYLFIKKE